MSATYERLIHLLDEREVRYRSNDESQSICADLRGDFGSFRVVASVDEDVDLFQVHGYSPVTVPEGSRPAVAEAITRANYGLRVGKFELDFSDGELRFHAYQIVEGDAIGDEVIDRLIRATIGMLDIYMPAFMAVIFGNEDPKDAVELAEAGSRPDAEVDEAEEGDGDCDDDCDSDKDDEEGGEEVGEEDGEEDVVDGEH